ncbi:MAG: biotin carboxylase N-terminal domain-containing protein [Bdellovibrionota bacterium]|nr:biotin carboxylase N-terminal domain-containing protein [Bdellovibrionota bacterium]
MIRQPSNKSRRILIANRGEIASRVAKACRELGHTAIGCWTDNERQAVHLQFCDEWVHLEGSTNAETYLNVEKILKVCKENNVDAVHPGYGFLSENADFAASLEKEGMIFIGPNVEAIKVMGDKATSKKLANNAGVPTVPGTDEAVPTVDEAVKIANEIGYPVLLKAVAGGGGRGMRACETEQDVRDQFEAVGRESLAAFNNGDLLVEKLIVNPHHIEVQILADKEGNTYHFYERECSIQRRHQKIVEEAPSPFIGDDEKLRQEICETAMKLAKAVNYDSAGTVEFIMREDKIFYFLEMNTRIKVEHPITQ